MLNNKDEVLQNIQEAINCGSGPNIARFALAGLSSIPLIGGMIWGTASLWSEKEQKKFNSLFASWVRLQEDEIKEIGRTIIEVMDRLDSTDEIIKQRIESLGYLALIKKCFRDWSAAESEYKRVLVRNLLASSAATNVCSDDVIRLFIEWIEKYSEQHFKVVGAIYNHAGITRKGIWDKIDGESVREDSAKADLFKLIIHDLSTGHVIRQHRNKDYHGNFIKKSPVKTPGGKKLNSAFDDIDKYELTELGQWLVHYTMNEIVPRITASTGA